MTFFSNFLRIFSRKSKIISLDHEIARLQDQKTELSVCVARLEAKLEEQKNQFDESSRFISIKELIANENLTLKSLIEEIATERNMLDTLKGEHSLASDCITLKAQKEQLKREIADKISVLDKLKEEHMLVSDYITLKAQKEQLEKELTNSIDQSLKVLFKKYPNVHPKPFNILSEFSNTNTIDTHSIKAAIDAQLTSFALGHQIDPILYKALMYSFNSEWMAKYEALSKKYNSLSSTYYENYAVFKKFIVLVDD